MGLRACKECGQQVSSSAKLCPHCGKKQGVGFGVGCLAVIAALVVAGVIGSIIEQTSDTGSQQTVQHVPTQAEVQAQARAKVQTEALERRWLETKAGRIWQKHKTWDRPYCEAIAKGKIMQGMNAEEIRAAWGRPDTINRTVLPGHTEEQWVYGDTYVYLDDGILTSWQDTR